MSSLRKHTEEPRIHELDFNDYTNIGRREQARGVHDALRWVVARLTPGPSRPGTPRDPRD